MGQPEGAAAGSGPREVPGRGIPGKSAAPPTPLAGAVDQSGGRGKYQEDRLRHLQLLRVPTRGKEVRPWWREELPDRVFPGNFGPARRPGPARLREGR